MTIHYRPVTDPVGIEKQVGASDVLQFGTYEAQQFIAKVRDGDTIVYDHPQFPTAARVLSSDHFTGSTCVVWVDVPPDERTDPVVERIFDVARNLDTLRDSCTTDAQRAALAAALPADPFEGITA